MKLQNKSRQISLATIFICAITPQVQAGFFDDLKNKAANATKQMMDETVEDVVGNKPPSPQNEAEESPATKGHSDKQPETVSKSVPSSAKASSEKKAEFKTGTSNGDLEIVGLRLGMSPSQAEAKLKSYNKSFKFKYENKELYGESRVHQSIHKDHRVIANTGYLSRIFVSNDGSTSYSPAKKGEWLVLTFAAPPSKNKLIHIRRLKSFLAEGPTTAAYDKAFIDKYGDDYFSQGNDKIIKLVSGEVFVNGDNKRCFYSVGKSLGHAYNHTYDPRGHTNNGCGLILASSFEPLDLGMQMIQKITMELADIDEMNLVADKTRKLIEDNNQKIRDDRLKAASKKDADIF